VSAGLPAITNAGLKHLCDKGVGINIQTLKLYGGLYFCVISPSSPALFADASPSCLLLPVMSQTPFRASIPNVRSMFKIIPTIRFARPISTCFRVSTSDILW